jgi:hypothetical protein
MVEVCWYHEPINCLPFLALRWVLRRTFKPAFGAGGRVVGRFDGVGDRVTFDRVAIDRIVGPIGRGRLGR